jgi:hypothetical protein
MEGTVIPLPSAYAGLPTSVPGRRDPVAVTTIEFVPAGEQPGMPDEEVLDRIHERCVRAALVVLGRHGITPVLSGTTAHPVVEGVFEGDGAQQRAAAASIEVVDAVRETQRVEERFLAASAGLAHGTTVRAGAPSVQGARGVQVTTGSPNVVAEHLRQGAGAGEILLGGQGWSDLADELGAEQLPDVRVGGPLTIPVWRIGPDAAGDTGP